MKVKYGEPSWIINKKYEKMRSVWSRKWMHDGGKKSADYKKGLKKKYSENIVIGLSMNGKRWGMNGKQLHWYEELMWNGYC